MNIYERLVILQEKEFLKDKLYWEGALTFIAYNPYAKFRQKIALKLLWKNKFFPLGLLEHTKNLWKNYEIKDCSVKWKRNHFWKCIKELQANKVESVKTVVEANKSEIVVPKLAMDYRDYQIDCLKSAIWLESGIIRMPTGSGKTLVSAGLFAGMRNRYEEKPNFKGIIIIHGLDLIAQTERYLREYLKNSLKVGSIEQRNEVDVVVASVDTLYSKIKRKDENIINFLKTVDMVILDECHRASSWNWSIVMRNTATPHIFAMSGTPLQRAELRDIMLKSYAGEIVYDLPVNVLQEKGYLAKADLLLVKVDGDTCDDSDWAVVKRKCIIENDKRTEKIVDLVKRYVDMDKRVMILVGNSIEFGRRVEKQCNKFGMDTKFLSGELDNQIRSAYFEKLRKKELKALIVTTIGDEGIDIPQLEVLILAYGGKSYVKVMQRIGRGLRPKENKLLVIDFLDNCHRFLARHTAERLKYYEEENIFDTVTQL